MAVRRDSQKSQGMTHVVKAKVNLTSATAIDREKVNSQTNLRKFAHTQCHAIAMLC